VNVGLVNRVGTNALVLVMADDGTVAFNTWSGMLLARVIHSITDKTCIEEEQ
jgi:hypothetical protein